MRFIGNKESMKADIVELLSEKGLLNHNLTFFDAFCGTGTIAHALKDSFNIVINDILSWCVIYTKGRIVSNECKFDKLGFNPFEFLNVSDKTVEGFMYKNYAPTSSNRMYFTPENAGRIDYFRKQIEEWKESNLISDDEYAYLLSSLIESVSRVSNTAGVYGAFLKKWDSRALKQINFEKLNPNGDQTDLITASNKKEVNSGLITYNEKIEKIISDVSCDVLYLDPPYTQNQYGTQYHLLETLVLDDTPKISPITGSRNTAPMRSDFSKEYKSNIKFDYVVANTRAKYILFSYNNDGFLSKEYIEACFKRYGKPDTYYFKKIPYKQYQNFKTNGKKEHFEYLFFVEKKEKEDVVYESPLNYIGSKSKMVPTIKKYLPEKIDTFYDLFGGGLNVGINIDAKKVVYNDNNYLVKDLVESFRRYDTYEYLLFIRQMIKKFGLRKGNSKSYLKAKNYYNSLPADKRNPRLLYTIILYGYQQQIRFNGNHDFNNTPGMRWFNNKVLEKMISFSRVVKSGNFEFLSLDFSNLLSEIKTDDFVYMDPPYMLTTGSYNDGKRGFSGWSTKDEKRLLEFADTLDESGIRFMISYVLEHGGQINSTLSKWIDERNYKKISIDGSSLSGSNWSGRKRKEVLIINYEN
ncbi:MAG: DNA adenine methylase [Thermoplasmatales archaeon B_DKE]|nr:MAG: DNA adenine methylase [Thermoplasmatales archaeon B_DKE]